MGLTPVGEGGIVSSPEGILRKKREESLWSASNAYIKAESSLDKATLDFQNSVRDALNAVNPQKAVDKAYAEYSKSFIPLQIRSGNNVEHTYMVPPDMVTKLWEKVHSGEWEGPWEMSRITNPDGTFGDFYIDPKGYGKEAHELFLKMPEDIRNGMLDMASKNFDENYPKVMKAKGEGEQQLFDYGMELGGESRKMADLYTRYNIDMDSALKGTQVEEDIEQRKKERTKAFKVIGTGKY